MNSAAPRIPGDTPSAFAYPTVVSTADPGLSALVVTSNFGNRYVGELNFSLDATTGEVLRDASGTPIIDAGSQLHRVSGNTADTDNVNALLSVAGSAASDIGNQVVTPVRGYVAAQEAIIVGTSQAAVLGSTGTSATGGDPRGVVGTVPGTYTGGTRNAENNLGNLVADSIRWYMDSDVAIQNGGGIRANIDAGTITLGEINSTLSFTNLTVEFPSVSVMQLKGLLEHGLSGASPLGALQGRFSQVSGVEVEYDSRLVASNRVQRIELVNDDGSTTLLFEVGGRGALLDGVDRGAAFLDSSRRLSLGTIDFLGNGGDGYPFAALGLTSFELPVEQRNYSEVLAAFIQAPVAEGGLGGVVSAAEYGPVDLRDFDGRLVDVAIAVPEPSTYAMMIGGLVLVGVMARRGAGARKRDTVPV
jgi:5'-nucleotidase